MITPKDILEKIKVLKRIEDTDIYDQELTIIISSSMSKLSKEGIKIPDNMQVEWIDQYIMCIFHYLTLVWDDEINKNISQMLYSDSVENLRMSLIE
jgi:hypothetical protein